MLDLNKEIIFASSEPDVSRTISNLIKQGKLRTQAFVRNALWCSAGAAFCSTTNTVAVRNGISRYRFLRKLFFKLYRRNWIWDWWSQTDSWNWQVGFDYYSALTSPFAKAIYMMFIISETHPFNDGNGRTARVMMNAELFWAGEAKIIVPTVYREDYLLSLRKLSRQGDPLAYIKVMETMHRFGSTFYSRTFDGMLTYLKSCNAFEEPENAKLKFK